MKKHSLLLSLLFTLSLLINFICPASALSQQSSNNVFSAAEMTDYAHSKIVSYLRINDSIEDNVSYFLTQGIPIENDNDPYNHIFSSLPTAAISAILQLPFWTARTVLVLHSRSSPKSKVP